MNLRRLLHLNTKSKIKFSLNHSSARNAGLMYNGTPSKLTVHERWLEVNEQVLSLLNNKDPAVQSKAKSIYKITTKKLQKFRPIKQEGSRKEKDLERKRS